MSTPDKQEDAEKLWKEIVAGKEPATEPAASEAPAAKEGEETPPDKEPAEPQAAATDTPVVQQGDELKELKEQLHRVKSDLGRLRAENAKLKTAYTQPRTETAAQTETVKEALRDPEKWAALKKDYPDIAEGVEAFIEERVKAYVPPDVVTRRSLEQDRAQELFNQGMARLSQDFGDWESVVRTDEFRAWLVDQPYERQLLADSPDPVAAHRLLEIWQTESKAAKQAPANNVNPRLKAAVVPQTKVAARTKAEHELEGEDYWNYLVAKEKQAA